MSNATPAADALSQRETHPQSEQQNGPQNRVLYSNNRMKIVERADGTIAIKYVIEETVMEISTLSPSVTVYDKAHKIQAGIHSAQDCLEITSDDFLLLQLIHGKPGLRVRHNPLK